jgi:hypothetical protein
MHNPSPQAPELKNLLAHIQHTMSPGKRLRVKAEVLTTEIIAQVQRKSRRKK